MEVGKKYYRGTAKITCLFVDKVSAYAENQHGIRHSIERVDFRLWGEFKEPVITEQYFNHYHGHQRSFVTGSYDSEHQANAMASESHSVGTRTVIKGVLIDGVLTSVEVVK